MLNFDSYRRPPNWKKAKAPASHDSDVERCQEEPAQKKLRNAEQKWRQMR